MNTSQYELCIEVLKRLDRAGVLADMIIIGSWCTLFYQKRFGPAGYMVPLRTRDMDLLIPRPSLTRTKVDVAELLGDLGFVVGFTGMEGYIRLEHPDLIVEFLVPERGRGSNKPYPLPNLGVNAQRLRFMDYLAEDSIAVTVDGVVLRLPQPARFALHKLVVVGRRLRLRKQDKDRQTAARILNALMLRGRMDEIVKGFSAMPRSWRQTVRRQLGMLADVDVPGRAELEVALQDA